MGWKWNRIGWDGMGLIGLWMGNELTFGYLDLQQYVV